MRFSLPVLMFAVVCTSSMRVSAQDAPPPPSSSPAATPGGAGTGSQVATPSALLQPSLASLQQALGGLRPEKWKISGELRDETVGNMRSITRDLTETLPPLLATADADPAAVPKVLPVSRNIDAVYDVALRVAATGKVAAPTGQNAALEAAMAQLQDARRELGDTLQANAVAAERRMADLQTALRAAQQPQAPQATPVAATPAKTPAKIRKPKPRPKPAASTPAAAPGAATDGNAKQP